MAANADLEARVARLEVLVREIAQKSGIETERGGQVAAALPPPVASRAPAEEAPWLSLAGVSVLAFAGAYVLRALTEASVLPRVVGVAAGLAYAALWIFLADRCARRGLRRTALLRAATAAGIAFPLVWETTTQFHFLSPPAGAAVAATIGLVLLFVAHRHSRQSIAWVGSVGAIGAVLSIASPSSVLPALIAGSVVGAATLVIAIPRGWTFVAWPAAALTNAVAVEAIGFPLLHDGRYASAGVLVAALVAFAALWTGAIVARRWMAHEEPQLFDMCETAILMAIGFGGAAFVALSSGTGARALGVGYLAASICGHVMAVTRRCEVLALFRIWIGALSSCMTAVALILLLPSLPAAAVAWAICGAIGLEFARRRASQALVIESMAALALASLLGGVAKAAIVSLFATVPADTGGTLPAAVIVIVAAAAYVRAGERRVARAILLGITAAGAFFALTAAAAHLFATGDRALLALAKTIVLATIASALALLARFTAAPGAIAIARSFLVLGGLKLAVEDVRIGRASVLVAAFAAFGTAMLIVARCARRHTSQPHDIRVTGSGDTFLDAAAENNVS